MHLYFSHVRNPIFQCHYFCLNSQLALEETEVRKQAFSPQSSSLLCALQVAGWGLLFCGLNFFISWHVGLLVMNPFSFCNVWKSLYCRILGWQFFFSFFQYFKAEAPLLLILHIFQWGGIYYSIPVALRLTAFSLNSYFSPPPNHPHITDFEQLDYDVFFMFLLCGVC